MLFWPRLSLHLLRQHAMEAATGEAAHLVKAKRQRERGKARQTIPERSCSNGFRCLSLSLSFFFQDTLILYSRLASKSLCSSGCPMIL